MATPDDIEAMAKLAGEAVEAGAIGFSTSRTRNHRSSNGELTPTLTADADELLGIARAVGATGTGVLQVVSDFDDVDAEFGLFRSMAEASGRPLSFSLAGVDPTKYPRQLELLDQANDAGVRMRGQAAARAIGILVGLQCTVNVLAGNPVWQEIAALSVAEQARAMAEPSFKERFLAAAKPLGGARPDVRARRPARLRARSLHEHRGRARPATGATPSTWPTTSSPRTKAARSSTSRSSTGSTARSTAWARCSPTSTPSRACPTAAPTSARSATPASRRRSSPTGAATGPRGASTSPTSCASTPRTPRRRSDSSTEGCSPLATGPT